LPPRRSAYINWHALSVVYSLVVTASKSLVKSVHSELSVLKIKSRGLVDLTFKIRMIR
jgi:hypothetical protein